MPPPAGRRERPVTEALAGPVEIRRGEASFWAKALREAGAVDRAVYEAVARTPTAELDVPLRRLSNAANFSRLWLGIAAAVAVIGGHRGRRGALEGVASIGASSALVNLGVKSLVDRRRPDRVGADLFRARHVPTPSSTSFPSGHAASAFAFTYGVSRHLPWLAVPLGLLATLVAYSRVHTGVHYPGDVLVGSVLGAGTATMVAAAHDRYRPARP
jgi:membrane-associated phospholipid phosphatase